jgi:hypothetical protein
MGAVRLSSKYFGSKTKTTYLFGYSGRLTVTTTSDYLVASILFIPTGKDSGRKGVLSLDEILSILRKFQNKYEIKLSKEVDQKNPLDYFLSARDGNLSYNCHIRIINEDYTFAIGITDVNLFKMTY